MDLRRPEVTVTDPRQPGAFVAVGEPPDRRLGRRGATVLTTAALVGVAALVATDVVRDRRDGVEQRRLDGIVDVGLAASSSSWSSSHDARTRTGTVEGAVKLVNRGPRDVRVHAAGLGALRGAAGETLEADGEVELRLQRTIACPRDGSPPPPEPQVEQLRLGLETPAGRRQLVLEGAGLPQGSLDDSLQRACLHVPLGVDLEVTATVVRAQARTVLVRVDVANDGRVPVRLLSLVPARGLVVESVGADAAGLPLVLPVGTARLPVVRTLEVRLGVVCGALLGAEPLRPFEELSAIVEDEDHSHFTSVSALARDPDRQLRQLADRTCASG